MYNSVSPQPVFCFPGSIKNFTERNLVCISYKYDFYLSFSVYKKGYFSINFIGDLGKCPSQFKCYYFMPGNPSPVEPGNTVKLTAFKTGYVTVNLLYGF